MNNITDSSKGINDINKMLQIFKGIIISIISTLFLLFIFSIVLTYTNLQETIISPAIIIITGISILIGSTISMRRIRKNGIIMGGIVGLIYILFLYLVSSIVEVGFDLTIKSIIMIIVSILAGMIGGIVRSKFK